LHSETKKSSLKEFIAYYSTVPWLALLRYLEVEQSKKVAGTCESPFLDLGCGDGFVADQVLRGRSCVGIDIDEKHLRLAQSTGAYRLVLNADARHLPFKDQTFGTVYSNGAMEHMNTLKAVITEIHRVLKKGGHLITFVPSQKFREPVGVIAKLLGSRLWNAFNMFQNHVNLLSSEQWHSQLVDGGFSVNSIDLYGDEEFAIALSSYDLCSKLHLQPCRPFFTLKHRGNVGRVLVRFLEIFKPLRVAEESVSDSKPNFFWLRIVACRPN
jgi:SAM-dependent methyltransferase